MDAKKQSNPRKYKSDLINALFEKDGKGGYTLAPEKPVFESYREAFHKRYGKDERKGLTKSIYLYQVFHGFDAALEMAIQKGEVQQWEEDGVTFCGNRQTKAGIEKASTSGQSLHSGAKALEADQWKTLSKAFSNMSWEVSNLENGDQAGEGEAAKSSSSSSKQKSLEMTGLTPQMEELVADAKSANERLLQSAVKMLSKCQKDEDKKSFKGTIMELKEWISRNENILQFKDLKHLVVCCIFSRDTQLKSFFSLLKCLKN